MYDKSKSDLTQACISSIMTVDHQTMLLIIRQLDQIWVRSGKAR